MNSVLKILKDIFLYNTQQIFPQKYVMQSISLDRNDLKTQRNFFFVSFHLDKYWKKSKRCNYTFFTYILRSLSRFRNASLLQMGSVNICGRRRGFGLPGEAQCSHRLQKLQDQPQTLQRPRIRGHLHVSIPLYFNDFFKI